MVSDGKQRGFCGMAGAEAVLRGSQKVIVREVDVELLMDNAFHDFHDHRNERDGPEICRV